MANYFMTYPLRFFNYNYIENVAVAGSCPGPLESYAQLG